MYSYIDMHCDTLLRTMMDGSANLYDGEGMQSIRQMKDAGQMCQFFAVFFHLETCRQRMVPRDHHCHRMRNSLQHWQLIFERK